jgi:hypothetical protein
MNAKNGFPVFSTHIEANYVSKSTDAWNVYKLTDEDRQKITALAADPRIGEWPRLLVVLIVLVVWNVSCKTWSGSVMAVPHT